MKLVLQPRFLRGCLLFLFLMLSFFILPDFARAVEFKVNATSDGTDVNPGDGICETVSGNQVCTLRAAIQEINKKHSGADVIKLPPGVYTLTLPGMGEDAGAAGDLDIKASLEIIGGGDPATTIIDGGQMDRVMEISAPVGSNISVKLSGVTLKNGRLPTGKGGGGGILVGSRVDLVLIHSVIRENEVNGSDTSDTGGGIKIEGSAQLTLKQVTIAFNKADRGGGISNSGTSLVMEQSTLDHNTAQIAAGLLDNGDSTTLSNSTLSNNTAGKFVGGIAHYTGVMDLFGVTLASNVSKQENSAMAAGIYNQSGTVNIGDTIVSGNTDDQGKLSECQGSFVSQGFNLIQSIPVNCVLNETGGSNTIDKDPLLGPLADNGGPTQTHALLAGSPAIDKGDAVQCPVKRFEDQRGITNIGATCDIGAFEFGSSGFIHFTSLNYSVKEDETTGVATITATRVGGSKGVASIFYRTEDGTAVQGTKYQLAQGTLNWSDGGDGEKTFQVSIINEKDMEGSQTVRLILYNANGALLDNPSNATLTIIDDDNPGILQFKKTADTVSEGAKTFDVIATRTGGSYGEVSVTYEVIVGGTATSGQDYSISSPGTLTWAKDDLGEKNISVSIVDDDEVEGNEFIILMLKDPTHNAVMGSATTQILTLTDNDSYGTIQFDANGYSVDEDSGTVVLNVSRAGGRSGKVSIDYTTVDQTAKAPADYTGVSKTLTWETGIDGPQKIMIPILDNKIIGPASKSFNVSLSNPVKASLGAISQVAVTISDDEVTKPGLLQLSLSDYSVNEDGGSATLTVSRVEGNRGEVSVHYTTEDGSAIKDTNYTPASGTLTWADGAIEDKTFKIDILDNAEVNGKLTVNLILDTPTNGAKLGTPATATLTIYDDEASKPGALGLSSGTYSVNEDAGSAVVTVSRVGGSKGAASVEYATSDGTAAAPADYTVASGKLEWSDGESKEKTFNIPINNDSLVEAAETLKVVLTHVQGADPGTVNSATVTIADDESLKAGGLKLGANAYSAKEDSKSITFTVSRVEGSKGDISVSWATSDGTGVVGKNYLAASGKLQWADGDITDKTLKVDLIDNTQADEDKTFHLTLSNPTGGAKLADPASATLTILEDDPVQIQPKISCGNSAVEFPEACDDGNTREGDGCSPTCTIEPGFECTRSPSVCIRSATSEVPPGPSGGSVVEPSSVIPTSDGGTGGTKDRPADTVVDNGGGGGGGCSLNLGGSPFMNVQGIFMGMIFLAFLSFRKIRK